MASPAGVILVLTHACLFTDSYSFGVLLWEIVTQEVPIRGQMRELQCPQVAHLPLPPPATTSAHSSTAACYQS